MNNLIGFGMYARSLDRARRREKYEGNSELARKDVDDFKQKNTFVRGIHKLFDTEIYQDYCIAKEFSERK